MVTTFYPTYEFKSSLLQKKHDFLNDDIKVILLTNNGSTNNISEVAPGDIMKYYRYNGTAFSGDDPYNIGRFELSRPSYTAGGISLDGKSISNIPSVTTPISKFDATDPVFLNLNTTGSLGVYGYALVNNTYTFTHNTHPFNYGVIMVAMFDTPQTVAIANFTIQFSTGGVFQL